MKKVHMPMVNIRLLVAVLLLIGLWLASSLTAHAGSMNMTIPGGAMIKKNVTSMREARYEDILRQETDFSCGAAALGTILRYGYGMNLTEPQVVEGLLKVSDPVLARERGFSLLDIKRYLETIGFRGRGYRINYDDLTHLRVPVLVLLDLKGYKHFVVMKVATDEFTYLADPALGNKRMKHEDFVESWNGVVFAVIGAGFQRDTVLRDRKEPPTVRRVALEAPLSDAELFEFGFTHGDLF